jgi:hypothetical protein
MIAASKAHLDEANETYFEHLRFAATVGAMAVAAGLACLIHALIPALCTRTCSLTIGRLRSLFDDRGTLPAITSQTSGAITFVGLLAFSAIIAAVQFAYGPVLIGPALALLTLGIPIAFLLSNPELEALAA